jgi:cupin 2 domain-containing protein
VAEVQRGRLRDSGAAPVRGESVEPLVARTGFSVEQILSGSLPSPVEYRQDHDEWVVVLAGGGVMTVEGASVDLSAGEWVLLPRGVPHRLMSTVPGTSWLAVRGPKDSTVESTSPPHGAGTGDIDRAG